jgi:hypothetical protein
LRQLITRGLEGTAARWPDIARAYGWVHRAAHLLNNRGEEDARLVRRRFDGLVAALHRHRGKAGTLADAIGHCRTVARSYKPGLFPCYAVPDLPRTNNDLDQQRPGPTTTWTNNDLEHLVGAQRYHERRASGRKAASPATVLRGEVRLIAATATRLRPPAGRELGRVSRERWTALRQRLDHRRQARTLRTRFRRNPDAYRAALEQQPCQPTLPA